MLRDVDGGAARHGRRRPAQGEPAEPDPGRGPRGPAVPRHRLLADVDRSGQHPREAARRESHWAPRRLQRRSGSAVTIGEAGGPARFPITVARTTTFFERVRLGASNLPSGWSASFDVTSLYGFAGVASTLTVNVPAHAPAGSYSITAVRRRARSCPNRHRPGGRRERRPTAKPPSTATRTKATIGDTTVPTSVAWPAATDPSSAIAGYELQTQRRRRLRGLPSVRRARQSARRSAPRPWAGATSTASGLAMWPATGAHGPLART